MGQRPKYFLSRQKLINNLNHPSQHHPAVVILLALAFLMANILACGFIQKMLEIQVSKTLLGVTARQCGFNSKQGTF